MYDMNAFGSRLAKRRAALNMTQDDLAARLGLSPQAISKWENGNAFPDITLLPALARAFSCSIDELFTEASDNAGESTFSFPETHEGLMLITHHQDRALYADIDAQTIEGPHVTFSDTSEAHIDRHEVINRGTHTIVIVSKSAFDETMQHKDVRLDDCTSFVFDVRGMAAVNVERGATCGWSTTGDESFKRNVDVTVQGTTAHFTVKMAPFMRRGRAWFNMGSMNPWSNGGRLTVTLPNEAYDHLELKAGGAVSFTCDDFRFATSSFDITGAGKIVMPDVGQSTVSCSGAASFDVNRMRGGTITSSGATNLTIHNASESLSFQLSGASKATLAGSLKALDLTLSGASYIKGSQLEIKTLKASLSGTSYAKLGRVETVAKERVSSLARLDIKRRD